MISIPNLGLSSSFASANLSAERYFRRALEKQRKGDYEGAIADYNEAIQINQNWGVFNANYFGLPTAYYDRGLAKSDLGDNQAAITDYNEAIRIQPDVADAYLCRGITKSALGDKPGGVSHFCNKYEYLNEQSGISALETQIFLKFLGLFLSQFWMKALA